MSQNELKKTHASVFKTLTAETARGKVLFQYFEIIFWRDRALFTILEHFSLRHWDEIILQNEEYTHETILFTSEEARLLTIKTHPNFHQIPLMRLEHI